MWARKTAWSLSASSGGAMGESRPLRRYISLHARWLSHSIEQHQSQRETRLADADRGRKRGRGPMTKAHRLLDQLVTMPDSRGLASRRARIRAGLGCERP